MSDQLYVIWSEEHGAWWRPKASGYTHFLRQAGRYTQAQVEVVVEEANRIIDPESGFDRERTFNEIAIPDPLQKKRPS
jgi:hypothetical protein